MSGLLLIKKDLKEQELDMNRLRDPIKTYTEKMGFRVRGNRGGWIFN